ncbi:MAG: hypothetical protein ACHQQQ_00170 [Bacteroidota bacterium]
MAVYLVTFDSKLPGVDYGGVVNLLKHYKYVRLAEGSFAIETHEATRTIYNKIMHYVSNGAHVYIMTVTKPFSTQCMEDVKSWLGKHLPQY